jgi:hypothetical protein
LPDRYFDGTAPKGSKYQGGRSFDDLRSFTEQTLGPRCDIDHRNLCTDDENAFISAWLAKSGDEVQAEIASREASISESSKHLSELLERLRLEYEEAHTAHEELENTVGKPLRFLKAISQNHQAASASDEL